MWIAVIGMARWTDSSPSARYGRIVYRCVRCDIPTVESALWAKGGEWPRWRTFVRRASAHRAGNVDRSTRCKLKVRTWSCEH